MGRLLAGVGGKALNGAVMGAAGGAAEGVVGYGISCVTSEEGCSVSGAAKASAVGAATGGVFGAAAGRFGRKSTAKQEPDGQPSSPGCRTGVPHSFTGLTGVLMANATTKPISEIKVGDYVLTAEPGKKKKEKYKVKAVIVTKTDRDFVDVVVSTKSGPKTIQTTKHHQFYESTKDAWTQAADLKAGQKLQNESGRPTVVLDVKAYTARAVTYDLSVEGLHTYHVGVGDTAVLVHNDDGQGPACGVGGAAADASGQWRNRGRFAANPDRIAAGTPHADGMLRGTNESGQSTSRANFRVPVLAKMWNDAKVGQLPDGTAGRVCPRQGPNCAGVVGGDPTKGEDRRGNWDGGHYPESWSNRKFPVGVSRDDVINNYNTDVRLECVPCNRGAGNREDG
ncbi:Hint domain-containing protein [Streptomyces sp. NPDC050422]|uniref:Hint domain-containing protein n=1 Tax=Streptomyces sp. NPDC050422 TaxID=3365614 RepID=UPI0037AFE55F